MKSISGRARYSLLAWSCRARVIAMTCSASLGLRSPLPLSRCWVRCPEEHGIGAVPVCSAKLASVQNRSLLAVWPIRTAAVSAPQPSSSSACSSWREMVVPRARLPASPNESPPLRLGVAGQILGGWAMCNSVPQATLPWSVTTAATVVQNELYEGVVWTLSEALRERLGGRVTGSVVVSVIPALLQGDEDDPSRGPRTIHEGRLRAHATLYRDGQQVPAISSPVPPLELRVKPR
jgi:hypothetical protein